MENAIQLNLFGDYLDFDEPPLKELHHETQLLGSNGSGTLEKTPPEVLPPPLRTGAPGADPAGSGGKNEGHGREPDGGRDASERSTGDSAPAIHPSPAGEGSGPATDPRSGLIDSPTLPRPPETLRSDRTDDRGNYHLSADDPIGSGGKVTKFEANLEAIQILKSLEETRRNASPEEQKKLVLYTGWGGISEVFKKEPEGLWAGRQTALQELLTPLEYRSASRSTMNAHYSSPAVISAIWTAVERMGYSGGPTLDPASGSGLFFGLRPLHLPIEMHGIELDSISGRIAQQLYQSATIKITGYEDIKMTENRYNLIISNVPFGDIKPYEESRNQTPGLDNRYSIHDFYFLKSLYGTRPGGMVAFITSRYTMDKIDTEVREKIAEIADFAGAIRLPNSSFKQIADTEVVTDIVFLQKRLPEQPMSDLTRTFISTTPLPLPSPDGTSSDTHISSYYAVHPEMILGVQDLSGTMYHGNEYTVNLPVGDLSGRLAQAIANLPENIMSVMVDEKTKELDSSYSQPLSHIDPGNIPAGTFIVGKYDRLYQKSFVTGRIELSPLYDNEPANHTDIDRIIRIAAIRDCVKDAFYHYYSGQKIEVTRDLSRLNTLYDAFVKDSGFLNTRNNVRLFYDDPDSSLLQSLEVWDPKTKTATKAAIFSGISLVRKEPITSVDSPIDAMVLSLSRYGHLNLPYMESLTAMNRDTLLEKLIASGHVFQDPHDYLSNGKETFITANQYLSGNIREKLRYATLAEEKNPAVFSRNVSALNQVMPLDIEARDIAVRMNSPIVGEKHVSAFIAELLDTYKVDIIHVPITGKWEIKCNARSTLNQETYGTHRMTAVEIINCIMNGKPVKVYDRIDENTLILNQEQTSAAELKADQIQNAFSSWLWKDKDRTDDIVNRYNQVYNSCVERTFVHPERMNNPHAEIRFHGCNFPFPMRSHQADAVWRVLQSNNTMLAHTVGAGKTLEMCCAAMELRRLGLRSKPMIVCPDHMIGQWAAEFRAAYPAAKLLIADDANWDRENRRTFINKIATGDWDAVILRAESFKMIPMSTEFQESFFNNKIAEYQSILDATDKAHRKTRSVKDLEKAIVKYKDKIKELTDMAKDEGVLPFDKLGVDHLFIDEADLFKNLEYYTQLQNVRGLGTPKGSERAIDMLMKIRYVQSIDGGITFATGTPISNTLVEAYTMQRFLQPETLKANGLQAFDEWARQYAETVTQMELNNTGTGYTAVTRFSRIVNVPELVTGLRQVWDIQTAHNLEQHGILVPGINLPRMKVINEAAPSTPLLQSFLNHLEQRERDLKGKPEKAADNVLSIMTDGRKAAIDLRLINPHLPDDPDSKLNLGVKVIHDVYSRFQTERYTCAVFFDKARSLDKNDSSKVLFDAVADMKQKLIRLGVKPHEIGDVRNCKTFDERRSLFEKVNDGTIRIIFGSTETMGAGTNFQTRLKAIVHVDAPWRPRDIEQQNGRGYRPGNTTGELEVYNLVTKGSLDTGLWNVLETKANSIRQVMDGSDRATRQIEENYFGSVKELSIDNALMKEAVELDHALRKLKSQKRSHTSEVAHAHRMMQTYPADIEKAKLHIDKITADMTFRPPEAKGDDFRMILDGKEYKERKDAGSSIKTSATTLFLEARAAGKDREIEIGSYCRMKLFNRSTLGDAASIGRITAQGPNFRYSAEVRQDSDPVGICRSMHNQIYRGMNKLLEDAQKALSVKDRNLEEFSRIASLPFPKKEDLVTKEKRYAEVMELLKKESESKSAGDDKKAVFPWSNLNSMTADEIAEAVQSFTASAMIEPTVHSGPPQVASIADLKTIVQEKYAVSLPPSIISMIEAAIAAGKMDPGSVYSLISATIERIKSSGFTWLENNGNQGYYSAYRKNPVRQSPGDIVILRKGESGKSIFEAHLVQADSTMKVLGSEIDFQSLKTRVEQYASCAGIRDQLKTALSADKNAPACGVREKQAAYIPEK